MMDYLKNAAWVLGLVALALAIGFGIEWFRRRALQKWALEQGGTFEPGSLLGSVEVPEAAAFDFPAGDDKSAYSHVTRIAGPDAAYVLAQHYITYKDTKSVQKTVSCVVCFITLPGAEWPAVDVGHATGFAGKLLGRPEPATVPTPDATPAFAAEFQVRPLAAESPAGLGRLLPPEVQRELLSSGGLIAGLQARGRVARVQAVGRPAGYPHAEVYAFARRLVAAWTR